MKLQDLAKKKYNGSITTVVDNAIGNLTEDLFNFMLILVEDYEFLPKHLQAWKYKCEVSSVSGFNIANDSLRDLHVE